MSQELIRAPGHFADIVPHPDDVRVQLERVAAEANLLRRLLRLSLRRQREAERLTHKGRLPCHA
jgi:hypothetical protein